MLTLQQSQIFGTYITTPECAKAIDVYLKYRERCGEILTEKSPLFREQFDINDLEQIKKKAKKITKNAIVLSITKRLHVAGIMPIEELKEGKHSSKKRKPVMRTHGFRKFVNTTFVNARLNDTIRNMLLGHSTDLDDVYYKPKSDDLLQEYLKAVDLLTINEENRLRVEVEQLTIKRSEIEQLKEQVEEYKILKSEVEEFNKYSQEIHQEVEEMKKVYFNAVRKDKEKKHKLTRQ